MTHQFSKGTLELISDAAVNAIDETRRVGMPDWDAREEYLKAACSAFDAIAADQEDAEPEQRPEFLG